MFDQTPQTWRQDWQDITNALPIPPRAAQRNCHIAVTARVVWSRDGEEQIDTTAMACTDHAVLVELPDRRNRIVAAWLPPADVTRR